MHRASCSGLAALCLLLVACSSGRSEAVKPEPLDAAAAVPPAPSLGERHREAHALPDAGPRLDAGFPSRRCQPHEMDCCGICIPRSEKRCPDNIHCKPPPPEM